MKILIINGPNLNMLEKRDLAIYGTLSLKAINKMLKEKFKDHKLYFYQSNHEGKIIDKIQKAFNYDALIINPAGYTHTSVAIRDALELLNIAKVAVHLSDIKKREDFRKTDLIADVVDQVFFGKKAESYVEAISYLIEKKQK